MLRTALGAGLGLALVAPFAIPAAGHGVGPTAQKLPTWDNLSRIFVTVFTNSPGVSGLQEGVDNGAFLGGSPFDDRAPLFGVGLLLLLAVVGLVQVLRTDLRFIARLAAAWALVPPLVLLPVVNLKPNLIMARYLVFVIPGWVILGGLGVLTLVELVRFLSGRHRVVRALTGGLTAVLVLSTVVLTQVSTLTTVREPGGHSENMRAAVQAADRPEYADLPIVVTALFSGLNLAAYNRADEARLIGMRVQRDQTSIWPLADPDAEAEFGRHQRIVLLLRAPTPNTCRQRRPGPPVEYVRHCMPGALKRQGFRVEVAEEAGQRWTFAVLSRPAGPADRTTPAPAR